MKKLLLTLTFLLGVLGMSAAEQVVQVLTLGSVNWEPCQAYDQTLESKDGLWILKNFNNNQNGWTYVKCGRQKVASVGEIITKTPVPEEVNQVVLDLNAITIANVNSIKLYISDNAEFTDAQEIGLDNPVKGENTFIIPSPSTNKYYDIKIDCIAKANGSVTVSGLTFYADDGKGEDTRTPVTLSFGDDTEGTVTLGDAFTLPELTVDPAAAKSVVTYSSDNEAVATIDAATGAVTVVGTGTAVFTASFDGNDEYLPAAPVTFTLKVLPALSDNELYIEFKLATSDPNTAPSGTDFAKFVEVGAEYLSSVSFSYAYAPSSNGIKLSSSKNNGSFTIKLAKSYLITGITVEAASYGSDAASLKINGETLNPNGTVLENYQLTYTPTTPTDQITIEATKRAYVHALTIYYETGDEGDYVEAPQFSVEGGVVEKGTKVELTCGTEGASIYYTLDGITPTTESTLYTAPITINETTTVSAIAVKEGMKNSPENKAVYTVVKSYTSLAEFIADAPQDYAIIDVPVTVFYYSSPYLYVTDGTTNTFLYSNSFRESYKNGDVIPAGFAGTYNKQYSEIEPNVATLGEPTEGTPIEPTVVSEINEVKADDYVKFENVTISGIKNKNATATLADGSTLSLFNRFGVANFADGEGLTIVGIGSIYNSAIQVCPTEIIEPEPTEVAALTITPEFGTIYNGQEIVIDCETEGALLYGNIGDTNINGEEMPYTYTVSEEAVGKTINVSLRGEKEGLTASAELKGDFTVAERPAYTSNEATFDWTNISTLTADKEVVDKASLKEHTFMNKGVAITFEGSSGTAPAYYANGNSLRLYNGSKVNVTLTNTIFHIEKITIEYASGSDADLELAANQPGSFSNGVWTPEAEVSRAAAADEIRDITFNSVGKTRVASIAVNYTDVPTGITAVEAAESDAPAVFYNLQGIRVNNPANGIFIRVQGTNVDKVLVK